MNNLQKLYQTIFNAGLIDNSFDDFSKGMLSENYQKKVFDVITQQGFFDQDFNTFKSAYVSKPTFTASEPAENDRKIITPFDAVKATSKFVLDKAARAYGMVYGLIDDVIKMYESGEGGFIFDVAAKGPAAAVYTQIADQFREKGYDIPDKVLWMDLTTPESRRAMYEDHLIESAKKGLSRREMQALDPTNKLKLEPVLDFFKKFTYDVETDESGKPVDYVELFGKGDVAGGIDAFTQDLASGLPSVIISRIPYGIGPALLGSSAYMSNFEEEFYNRLGEEKGDGTKISREDIVKNSIITGGADFTTEYFGGKMLNTILKRIPGGRGSIEKLLTRAPQEFMKKVGLGFITEFTTEGGAGVIREAADALTYGDDKGAKDYFRVFMKDGFIGGFLGAGTTATLSRTNKEDIYEYVSPGKYKQSQLKIESEIIKAKRSLAKAKEVDKPYFKNKIKSLEDQKKKNKENLYEFFENMTDERKKKYAQNIDLANKALNIIGNRDYTQEQQEAAKKELEKYTQANSQFFYGTEVKYDPILEAALGRVMKASERIRSQKNIFGFSRNNVDIKYINTDGELQQVIEQNPELAEIAKSDGVFIAESKDGSKPIIYINTSLAAQTEQTNVIGHEFLHAIISDAFKKSGIGRENLKSSVSAFAQYLRDTGNQEVLETIEDRLADQYGALTENGQVLRDNTLNIVQFDDKNQDKYEEYFNIFSDVINSKKIKNVPGKDAGITKSFSTLLKGFGFNSVDFQDGKQVFDFLVDYNKNINRQGALGKIVTRTIGRTKITGLEAKGKQDQIKKTVSKSMTATQRAKAESEIKKLGKEGLLGEDFSQKGGKFLFDAEFSDIYNKIKNEGYLDNLIAAQYKGGIAPKQFVDKVYSELTSHAKRFDPEINDNYFAWLNSQIANKAGNVYNREYKADQTTAGRARDIGETTQEGEIKVQVAADKDTALEALETEDLSVAGQARAKAQKTERQSKLRRRFGFETGGKMYNSVLESGKKSLLIAYRRTQSIKDPAKRARAIKDLLRKEYFTKGLTSDLFKSVKNFLGTKEYINNLKQYREAIVEALSTADLVQIERKVPDSDRIFTVFDKKLTKIEDVEAAVQKGLLPTEAINAIQKGQAVNLYKKRMPTESELIEFADQPAINPVTGQRSGLKGTRKDGFAKAIANTMVLDAVMEVRQSEDVVEALQDDAIAQLDLMALSDAVGREVDVKFSKSTAVADINNAIDNNINLSVYSQIKFSRSHRDAYEARLTKKRTDLDEKQIKSAVESIFKFVEGENIPNNKKAKYEKMAMHYMANGNLILPEDGYKVIEAERIAAIKKIDPFSYKNPTSLIEKFAGEVKGARTNPDTVQEFTNKTNVGQGVTVYDVADSKEGQLAVRKVIDTHFGKKANPWCLCARTGEYYGSDQAYSVQERDQMVADQEAEGRSVQVYEYREDGQTVYELTVTVKPDPKNELKESFVHWKDYNKQGNGYKIAFKNGKLLCFRDGNKKQWWNRNDEASDKIHFTVTEKKGNVENVYDVTPEDGAKTLTRRTKGKMPTAEVYTRNEDNSYIYESDVNYVDGRAESIRLETTYKDKKLSQGIGVYDGVNPDIQFNNITKDVQTTKNNVTTSIYEGKVVLTSKQFKEFENKTVEIKHVINAQTSETISLAINGIEQNIDAKFSKSAAEINYSKALNSIKFSRKKQDPYIADQLNIARELGNTSDEIVYARLEQELKDGTPLQEAHAAAFKEAYGDQAAEIIQQDGNSVKDLQKNINKFYLPKVRAFAKDVALKKYAKLIKAAKGDIEAQQDLINSFLINYGRPIRSGKVLNITTNRALLSEMEKAFGKEAMAPYNLVPVDGGEKVMVNNKDIDLYKSVTPIKLDPAKYKETINSQAIKAKDFLFEDILGDNSLSNGQKKALVQLIFYGQKGPGRKMYKLGVFVEGMRAAETTLEHEITAKDMHNAIIDVIDGKKSETELKSIIDKAYVHVLPKEINNVFKKLNKTSKRNLEGYESMPEVLQYLGKLDLKGNISLFNFSKSKPAVTIHNAIMKSKSVKDVKGITILDFDDTLATSKSLVRFTRPDGSQGTLTPEQYASTYEDLLDLGYKFDFSEFNKVIDGKPAPLLNKAKKLAGKFGTKDMFVLTARPSASAKAIREFLKQNGLDIPLKNITGLGNSTAEAKALWVADKVADGYNDFYFADDALKNVQAVQNMLNQFDVKSKVQQARIKFSKSKKQVFDSILKRNVGIDQEIDAARAKIIGANKGKREFFIAPGADDFQGLLLRLAGKGKQGETDVKFFKQTFFDPFNRAYRKLNGIQYNMMESYAQIRKDHKNVIKKLKKKFDNEFTNEDAIRIYLWHQQGLEVPGLTSTETKAIADKVAQDSDMVEYALKVRKSLQIQGDQYLAPTESWMAGSIKGDMYESLNKVHRSIALQEWQENVDELLNNQAQLAKLEAAMGTDYVEALKDILYRMRTGKNRTTGQNAAANKVLNWLQGSVGAIMFFNMRSAVLQTISTVNYINHTDNNIFAFAKAIGNVKQFAKDFVTLFNSPQLKVRRSGLQQDIQTADLADSLSRGGNAANALAYLLKIGFTPTQVADSFAIAFGGATFYRNRINTYLKQGMTQEQAESQAMIDFQDITEESQQSSRPDRISKQQASTVGRLLLAFQNTPLQYNRIIKKAVSDIANNRGDKKTHISRISYYGAVQAFIFYALQQALFADDEPEEEEVPGSVKREYNAGIKDGSISMVEYPNVGFYYQDVKNKQKKESLVNSMADSWLRGSGVKGAVVSTFKNVVRSFMKESKKGYKADYFNTFVEVLNLSPQIGSKARKIKRATDTYKYNKDIISEIGAFDIDNPAYPMITSLVEGTTNAPVHRIYTKLDNLKEAFNEDNTATQRLFVALGWNQWQLGIDTYKDVREAKDKIKEEKKAKKKQCRRILSNGRRCSIRTTNKSQLCYHHN